MSYSNCSTRVTSVAAPIGDYVKYKDTMYVVVDFNDDVSQLKLLDPTTNVKLMVSVKNIKATGFTPMIAVEHQGKDYLLSRRGLIISLTTGRRMKWDSNNGNRIAIDSVANF